MTRVSEREGGRFLASGVESELEDRCLAFFFFFFLGERERSFLFSNQGQHHLIQGGDS